MPNIAQVPQGKAADSIDKFLDKVVGLPPAPQILPKLLEALRDDDTDLDKVMDLITFDPGLTIKVLHVSNSAFFGLSTKINSVFEAIQQLGSQKLYCIVTGGAGRRLFISPYRPTSEKQVDPWRHAVMTAFACQSVAENIGADPATMFTAGLLHDVGRVPLLLAFKDDYWAFQQEEAGCPDGENTTTELNRFGFDHANLGGRLLQRWKFSRSIISSVSAHHTPLQVTDPELRPLAACVSLGESLAASNPTADHEEFLARGETRLAMEILDQTPQDVCRYREAISKNMEFIDTMCSSN